MGGVREDAEDALSRAMLRALDRLPDCAAKITNLKAWLTRLVCNLCVDIHRERKRRKRGAIDIDDLTSADDGALVRCSQSPEDVFFQREMCGFVMYTVDSLPAPLREPFVLRFFQEMAYPDIAEQLTLSPDNVRKRIQQARAILRERVGSYLAGDPESIGRNLYHGNRSRMA
jgi:RNA polymerase sigma-70 factor (ECF subfamily)